MIIRLIKEKDSLSIAELSEQLGFKYPLIKTQEKVIEIMHIPDHYVFVAEIKNTGKIAGYIHIEVYRLLYSDDFINILGIVVADSMRNSGIGTMLINKAETVARDNNCAGIRAASSSKRIDAHQFYKRNGFSNKKTQQRFIKYLQ